MSDDTASQVLGRFVAGTAAADVPEPVKHAARRSLLNFTGCALGVAAEPAVDAAVAVMRASAGDGSGVIFARAERLHPMGACFVNAVAGNLLDYDDTHLPTVIHPSAPVIPPVLALAHARGASGEEALLAMVLGIEVACRLGNALSPGHYARGWHITATCGVFGAAAACAKLLGLDASRTADALGIAASSSGGVVENLSTAAKNVGVGSAARGGWQAALFAAQGYAAAPAAIDGALGFARASGDEADPLAVRGELGERWEVARNAFKPYPAGIVMHSVIDACLALRAAHDLTAAAIREVVVSGDALLLARGDRAVHGERDGRVSIHHAAAAAFLWGRAGVTEFAEASVMSEAAVDFRARVRPELDASLGTGAARVRVETRDGERYEHTVHSPRGSLEAPLSDEELESKARELAALGGSGCDVDGLIEAAWRIDAASDVDRFMRSTLPP